MGAGGVWAATSTLLAFGACVGMGSCQHRPLPLTRPVGVSSVRPVFLVCVLLTLVPLEWPRTHCRELLKQCCGESRAGDCA